MNRRIKILLVLPLIATLGALGGAGVSGSSGDQVAVVGYSTISTAYSALETAFQATSAGQGVTFTNSFGASGTQAQDVAAGLPADVLNLSLIPDINTDVSAGVVPRNWQKNPISKPEDGFVANSTVVIVVRPGNPLGITGWNSLTQSGVQIVTPDPISSGSAKWNLLAAYYSQVLQGKKRTEPHNYLNSVITNTVSEPSSGSKALSTFLSGTGNVLLAYESDAQAALAIPADAAKMDILYPAQNILIQTPAALTDTGLQNPGAVAFFKFLFSDAGQTILAQNHYRATIPAGSKSLNRAFYSPKSLTTITKLGGWSKVWAQFFSSTGLFTRIENAHGYTT
ncbi:MAG: sulfate transporter, periplasmic sulfate-binding protein [Acidimicrobiaceae bacterium]|nr:sulfate transporter, periplasmic sulfate-binding protein [Acidimicrobiaceae bacterium]